ncbi:MAG: primosomal protein N' [Spirulina sp. SIO3F2]|nr:primosomal protein N' [Spirulina sp. SIO3F2]
MGKIVTSTLWANVLVDCPGITDVLTYVVPSELTVQPGDVVQVPVGSRTMSGIVARRLTALPDGLRGVRVKPIAVIVAPQFLPADYLELLVQVADYYYAPLVRVVQTALPSGLLQRSQHRIRLRVNLIPTGWEVFCSDAAQHLIAQLKQNLAEGYTIAYLKQQLPQAQRAIQELSKRDWLEQYYVIPPPPRPQRQQAVTLLNSNPPQAKLSARQQEVLQVLQQQDGQMWVQDFLKLAKTTKPTLERLADLGCVVISYEERLRLGETIVVQPDQPKTLTNDQAYAIEQINQTQGTSTILLHGVTGSGKTEVYLQAIAPCLEQGQSALVLVPEIGLTPQLTDRFRARFGDRVRIYHSELSTGERYDSWRWALTGEPQVVIGTRSAVFVPLPNLGLIVLDEEHDHSFKESQRTPTYHARTVAEWRSQRSNCPLILGSATPALETWQQAREQSLQYLTLPHRIAYRPLPDVEVVDMRRELKNGNRSMFSEPLQTALEPLRDRGEKAILFIPRRGHSTFVQCRSCGYTLECPDCDVSLSYHYAQNQKTPLLRCHYCNHVARQPRLCPDCQSPYLKFFGTGTQQVEQAIAAQFPHLRVIRFDSDTTRRKGQHRQLLAQFAQGEADILLGTQMLTKGIDIADVTVVGILAADGLLKMSSYRAGERAFQTLTQVAGRAGRGERSGLVILQTYGPEQLLIEAIRAHDYGHLCQLTLPERREQSYPPYSRLVLLQISGLDEGDVQQAAQLLAQAAQNLLPPSGKILGPAPALIMRIQRRYRWQVLLKLPRRKMWPDLSQLYDLCPQSVSLLINVDPLEVG